MNLNQKRKQIFNDVKNYVEVNGWNKEIFLNLKNSNFDYNEIISLFPNGYLSTIQMYLDDINSKMALESKKLNLIQLRLHERVRELCNRNSVLLIFDECTSGFRETFGGIFKKYNPPLNGVRSCNGISIFRPKPLPKQ